MHTCHRIKLSLLLYKISLLNSLGQSPRLKEKIHVAILPIPCVTRTLELKGLQGTPFRPMSPGGGQHSLL